MEFHLNINIKLYLIGLCLVSASFAQENTQRQAFCSGKSDGMYIC
jgi:hypothetical protein